MTIETEQQAAPAGETVELSAADQASIEVGQRGLSEPTNPNTPAPSGPARPEWCPEQFWKDGVVDNEGLAKSYSSLRGKMDGKPAEEAPVAEAVVDPEARTDGKIVPAELAAAEAAVASETPAVTSAMEAARDEWAETQELSDDTFAALEAAGIPRPIVDLYLEGIKANSEKLMGQIHGYVGGEEAYSALTKWAAGNLPAAEIEAYNDALDNPALRETAVVGLQAKFARAVPSEGKLVTPNDGGSISSDVFQSRDELVAAQKDPRYQTDGVYRQSVIDKLTRSQSGGFAAFDRPKFGREIHSS